MVVASSLSFVLLEIVLIPWEVVLTENWEEFIIPVVSLLVIVDSSVVL